MEAKPEENPAVDATAGLAAIGMCI